MIVLVCGGRTYPNQGWVFRVLDTFHGVEPITLLRHGASGRTVRTRDGVKWVGADVLAGLWAESRKVTVDPHPAEWTRYGNSAGFIRNQRMLAAQPRIDCVIAFPGSSGTADMVQLARSANIPVLEPGPGE